MRSGGDSVTAPKPIAEKKPDFDREDNYEDDEDDFEP